MGLDIYIRRVKRTRKNADAIENSDWEKVNESSIEQDTKKLVKAYKLLSKRLKCVDSDAYAEEYKKGVRKLFKFFNYPNFDLCDIGVELDTVLPLFRWMCLKNPLTEYLNTIMGIMWAISER